MNSTIWHHRVNSYFSSSNNSFLVPLAVSQILDSLEDMQWLTLNDRVELDFLQKLFEDKQLQTLLQVK